MIRVAIIVTLLAATTVTGKKWDCSELYRECYCECIGYDCEGPPREKCEEACGGAYTRCVDVKRFLFTTFGSRVSLILRDAGAAEVIYDTLATHTVQD